MTQQDSNGKAVNSLAKSIRSEAMTKSVQRISIVLVYRERN